MQTDDLHQMARMGMVQEAEKFFKQATDSDAQQAANTVDDKQRTPLHLACWAGKVDMIRLLLEKRAEFKVGARDGFTPLHFCAQAGCEEGCQLLLEAGADVNAQLTKTKKTPLHLAVAKGHPKAVLVLVQAGADKYRENNKGETPLHLVSSESVKAALHAQALPTQPSPQPSDNENQQRPNPTAAAADQNQGNDGRQEGGQGQSDSGDTNEQVASAGSQQEQQKNQCGDVESAADLGQSEPTPSAGVAGTAPVGAGEASVAGIESVVTQPAAAITDGVGAPSTAGDDGTKGVVVEDGEAAKAGSGAAGVENKGKGGEEAQSRMSLAERRRKTRKLLEGAGGVSLSHLEGDGEEV